MPRFCYAESRNDGKFRRIYPISFRFCESHKFRRIYARFCEIKRTKSQNLLRQLIQQNSRCYADI
ncbi:hypothetical protein ACWIUD_03850 [Helicobacter sp. 23-1044]